MGHCKKATGRAPAAAESWEPRLLTAVLARILASTLLAWLPAAGHALCTSEGVAQPDVLLERFVSADCEECWRDPRTPAAATGTLALDWVVPGRKGEDAPLSVVASRDALPRLETLKRAVPPRLEFVTTRRQGPEAAIRLAQGAAFNDYIGTSIALAQPGREPWQAWLLLVENLPAGTEGSPVERNLVRNVFRPDWGHGARRAPGRLAEARSMQIHDGARPERLRLVAVLQDARGRIRAIVRTECP
jgi:hypothetical protein